MKTKNYIGKIMLTVIPIIIIASWVITAIGFVYLFVFLIIHPELIGEYIGKIMRGF